MTGARKLADYPARKIVVACDRCGWRKQYDKAGMIIAGGADRPLTLLLDAITRKQGCKLVDEPGPLAFDRCKALYSELADLLRANRH